jgi:O-antigen ligase
MYVESNGLAIHIIVVLFFTFWWGEYLQRKFLFVKILLIIVLCLTFSRAAIFSFSIGILYYKYFRKLNRIWFTLLIFFSGLVLIFILPTFILPFLKNDASSNTKVELIDEVFKYYLNADWVNIIFGIGNYNSMKVFSIYAHNYILVFAVETGLLGLTLLFTQFIHFILKSRNEILVVLVPFFVQVMSSTTIFIPHFYMVSAIIIYFSRQRITHQPNSCNLKYVQI